MSGESADANDNAYGKEAIPVCNLFSDGATRGTDDTQNEPVSDLTQADFSEAGNHSLTSSADERKGSEPALCNVFIGSSASLGSDDIFSKISTDGVEATSKIANNMQTEDVPVPTMETLHLSPSVDSFIVEDLVESDAKSSSENLPTETDQEPESGEKTDPAAHDLPGETENVVKESSSASNQDDGLSKIRRLQKPDIVSSSFASIASFSIESDEVIEERYADQRSSSPTELTELEGLSIEGVKKELTEVEGLSIEGVKKELIGVASTADKNSSENIGVVNASEEEVLAESVEPKQADVPSAFEEETETQTTEALFPSQQDNDQSGLFGGDKTGDLDEDDPFAAALINSALDRRRDAWIPSEATKAILMSCTADQKPPALEMESITRPGLSTSEILEDPVKELVTRLTGSESVVKRENLTIEDVTQDKIGVEKLMESGNHRSAANLCAKLLAQHGQGFGQATQMTTNTPDTLWLWYTRIYILTKLKLYEMAATELSAFKSLDNPDLYFEFYPDIYPGRHGSMVPFDFRLLHAEFPRRVEKPQESLNRLCKISAVCSRILDNLNRGKTETGEESTTLDAKDLEASVAFWTERKIVVLCSTGNVLIHLNEYVLAVKVYDEILGLQPENAVTIQSGIGRLFLHIGDIRSAKERFTIAEQTAGHLPHHKVQLLLNRGFMYIGTNNWKEAFTQFDSALNLEPTNITALNNKAVCLLYLSRLKDAIAILENGAVQQTSMNVMSKVESISRQQVLVEGLISNLSTLYELESSRFVLKKRALFLKQMAPTCGDSFNTACFKEI